MLASPGARSDASDPADRGAALRAEFESACEKRFPGEARVVAQALLREFPNASTARFLSSRFDAMWPDGCRASHNLAVLRSFTVEPVIPLLQAHAAVAGVKLHTWVGEFGAYGQEILSATGALYREGHDTILLAVLTRDVTPALWERFAQMDRADVESEIATAVDTLAGLAETLRKQTPANIVVQGLEPPLRPSLGFLDGTAELGQVEAIARVNAGLRARLSAIPNAYVFDYADVQARHGRERFLSETKWASVRLPLSVEGLGWLASTWWRWMQLFALPRAKVLALDLDNTLWGGTIGEDGLAGIRLGEGAPGAYFRDFQRAVLDIAGRGVLLALVSKNNSDEAMQVFAQHPAMLLRAEHFAAIRINWEAKTDNLVALADDLNLGLESIVFVDDNPVERSAVRRALPEIIVPELAEDPSTYAQALLDLPALERLQLSAEDAVRNDYYAVERIRQASQVQTDTLEDFLASLDLRAEISPIDAVSLPRAAQLTQKTNQLNTTTHRYTEAQLAERLRDPSWSGYALRAWDRFGDYGIVGLALAQIEDDACHIDSLLLSCRVIGRGLDTALLSFMAEFARQQGVGRIDGWYLPTKRNAPARDIFKRAGFNRTSQNDGAELWTFELKDEGPVCPSWIARASTSGEQP